LIVLIIIIFYFLFDTKYFSILQSIQIPTSIIKSFDKNIHLTSDQIRKENNISRIYLKFSPSIPSYYPQLPIHIFTQNLTSLKNQSKLILLGNEFFGDQQWGLNTIGKSSTELSNKKLKIYKN
jgi:hypothetical protein